MKQSNLVRTLALACVLAGGSSIFAQSAVDGAVGGTIHDATGANVSGATVNVRNNGTGAEQTVTTDGSGDYRVIHLQPGTYTVTVTGTGFGTYKSTAVVVQVGLLTNVEPMLTTAGTEQVVDVTSELPAINTTNNDFANVIDLQILGNLPVNNFRWSSYAQLTPGVVSNSDGFGLLSFRGQSVLQNNITIDGADDNQAFFAEERGRTRAGYSTAQSAVQEFQVNTSNYTVEYGRAVGGVVNSITKSGTNTIHGDLYFFDRDQEWGTKSPTTVNTVLNSATNTFVSTVIKPKDWRKQFGGGVGGPILKDKAFFFLAIDKYKRNFPGNGIATSPAAFFATPDAALPTGKVCGTTTGAAAPSAPDAGVCTIGTALGVTYANAAPLYNSGLAGLSSILGFVPRTGDQNIFFPKVDYQINGRNHVSLEVNRLTWASPAGIQTQAVNTYGVRSFGDDFVKLTFGVAKLDTTITNNLVNEVRYQYGRDFEYEGAQQPSTAYEQANLLKSQGGTYTNPLGLPPQVFITNGFTFGTPTFLQRPAYPDERRWQVADTANYTRGRHSFKFGFDYLHTDDLLINLRTQYGSYSYNSVGSYLADLYSSQSTNPALYNNARRYSSYQQAFGPLGFEFVTHDVGVFAQDEWKIVPRLSLTLGLRYDYEVLPGTYGSVLNPSIAATKNLPTDENNIAPRVGFALDPFNNGKTSVRGGFGIFYGRTINSTIYSALTSTGNLSQVNGTPVSQATFTYTSTQSGAPNFATVLGSAGAAGAAPAVAYFTPDFQNPASYQYDLAVQQDLGYHTSMAVSFIGALGRNLTGFVDQNLTTPSTITYTVADATGTGPLLTGTRIASPFYGKLTAVSPTNPNGVAPTCAAGVNGPNAYASSFRPNGCYGVLTAISSNISSNYSALVAQLKHQLTSGLSFEADYTWSHAIDYGVNGTTGIATNSQSDPTSLRPDYGNSDNNVPNRLVVYATYQTPKHFHGALGYLLNSYEIAPNFAGQNGLPYSATTSGTPTTALTSAGVQSGISSAINAAGGAARIPVLGRNRFQQRRTLVADLRVTKRFDIKEHSNFELIIESFNIANHQNVVAVNTTAYLLSTSATADTLTYNTPFGTPTAINSNFAYSTRQVQVGGRFHF